MTRLHQLQWTPTRNSASYSMEVEENRICKPFWRTKLKNTTRKYTTRQTNLASHPRHKINFWWPPKTQSWLRQNHACETRRQSCVQLEQIHTGLEQTQMAAPLHLGNDQKYEETCQHMLTRNNIFLTLYSDASIYFFLRAMKEKHLDWIKRFWGLECKSCLHGSTYRFFTTRQTLLSTGK